MSKLQPDYSKHFCPQYKLCTTICNRNVYSIVQCRKTNIFIMYNVLINGILPSSRQMPTLSIKHLSSQLLCSCTYTIFKNKKFMLDEMSQRNASKFSVLVKYANLKSLFGMGEQGLLKQRISKLLPPKLNIQQQHYHTLLLTDPFTTSGQKSPIHSTALFTFPLLLFHAVSTSLCFIQYFYTKELIPKKIGGLFLGHCHDTRQRIFWSQYY